SNRLWWQAEPPQAFQPRDRMECRTSAPFPVFIDGFEGGHRYLWRIERTHDAHRHMVADMAHDGLGELDPAAAQLDGVGGRTLEHDGFAGREVEDAAERQVHLVEDRIDLDIGGVNFGGEVPFPDRVAAELLAHVHLEQLLADGLDGGVGQQNLDLAAAIV